MTDKKSSERIVCKRKFLTFVGREVVKKVWDIRMSSDGQWFGSDWPYILEDGFPPFYVNISSHLVLYDSDKSWDEKYLYKNVKKFFEKPNRRQMGAHLFSTRFGKVQMVYMAVHPKNNEIETSEIHDINAVYPVIRNEEEPGVQKLLLGLFYGNCKHKKNKNEGLRVYHRFDYGWTQAYNCWEITEQWFDEQFVRGWRLLEEEEGKPNKIFALYVCPSAKLMVRDNCLHEGGTTRSLIQQGGIVIVEGEVSIRVKDLESVFSFVESLNNGFLAPNDPSLMKELLVTHRPVLFLGATDSKYGSICWDLTITQKKSKNMETPSSYTLMLPEGGRFEAIEHWSPGMKEIWCRHSYQRLHESNVIQAPDGQPYTTTEFSIPSKEILKKIFDLGTTRVVRCDHKMSSIQTSVSPLLNIPREHNIRKVVNIKEKVVIESKDTYGLSIPPAYPPIEYKVMNSWHYLYLPNNKEKDFTENISNHYVWYEFEKGKPLECCLQFDKRVYRLKKEKTIVLDQYESCKSDNQLTDKHYSERYPLCDGVNTRLGADGWIYKNSGKVIANYETQYYYRHK